MKSLKQQLDSKVAEVATNKVEANKLMADIVSKENELLELQNAITSKQYTIEELTQSNNLVAKELKITKQMMEEKDKVIHGLHDEISKLKGDLLTYKQNAVFQKLSGKPEGGPSNPRDTFSAPSSPKVTTAPTHRGNAILSNNHKY